jgi:hypothetical protein
MVLIFLILLEFPLTANFLVIIGISHQEKILILASQQKDPEIVVAFIEPISISGEENSAYLQLISGADYV